MCTSTFTPALDGQSYRLIYRAGTGLYGLACWMALPRDITPGAPPLVAVHGIRRGAKLQAALFAQRAAALGRPVIAPVFDRVGWPRYQQAVLAGRADLALLSLLRELENENLIAAGKMQLFGFSGGAQFVHRFALLYPDRIARLTIAAPGWYTFPDDAPFPYGLTAPTGRTEDWAPALWGNLDDFLRLPMEVCVGEADCVPDRNTRRNTAIDAQQGQNRMARAVRWTGAVRGRAAERGITPRIRLNVLRGCGHDFATCVIRGGLDRIVIPETAARIPAPCSGRCSEEQRLQCLAARSLSAAPFMEATP